MTATSAAQRSPTTQRLAKKLNALANGDDSYWSFADRDDRQFVHCLFQYPAMMVPRLQRQLLETCITWDSSIGTVYDPFMGSGTVLTESMLLGKNFFGGDINPLAVLVAQAKSDRFDSSFLVSDLECLLADVREDSSAEAAVEFRNLEKWFAPHVIEGLSRLRRAIIRRSRASTRRFWWVALAETVRLSSNSRTSTVKLHLRPAQEIENRPMPVSVFEEVARRNLRVLAEQEALLLERNLLAGKTYSGTVSLKVGSVTETKWRRVADVMMTSPPYGDNHTTVTYGQASYLPLQWIDRSDILGTQDRDCVENTHRIDTLSLGGKRSRKYARLASLLDRSPHFRRTFESLPVVPGDRRSRVASFYSDLDASLTPILEGVRSGGVLIWTTGDRTVGGVTIQMAPIVRELLGRRVEMVTTLKREIPSTRKRMAARNATTATMGSETILVLRKV